MKCLKSETLPKIVKTVTYGSIHWAECHLPLFRFSLFQSHRLEFGCSPMDRQDETSCQRQWLHHEARRQNNWRTFCQMPYWEVPWRSYRSSQWFFTLFCDPNSGWRWYETFACYLRFSYYTSPCVLTGVAVSGRAASIGLGFSDRSDSFDLNVALQDHFKWLKKSEEIAEEKDDAPKADFRFKEGETIKINMKITVSFWNVFPLEACHICM